MVELEVTAGNKRLSVISKEHLRSCAMLIFPGVELVVVVSML